MSGSGGSSRDAAQSHESRRTLRQHVSGFWLRQWAEPRPFVDATMAWPVRWDGGVTLPDAPSASRRFRLVVAEFEKSLSDDAEPYGGRLTSKGRRMVYVEHTEFT